MKIRTVFLLAAVISVSPAFAQDDDDDTEEEVIQKDVHPYLTDKFRFNAGIFSPEKKFKLSADGTLTGDHPEYVFEESFGMSDTEGVFTADFHWKFGKKWFFETQYYEVSSEGGKVLEEDFEWNDVVFPAGSFANAGISFDVWRMFFGREFITTPNSEFAAGAGIHWLDIEAFVEGEILLDESTTGFHHEEVGLEGPLPNIGFSYIYSTSPKWAFVTSVNWLSLSIDKWSGGFWDVSVGGNYQFTRHFGMSLQYLYLDLDVTYDDPDWSGDLDITFKGPYLSIGWSW